LHNIVTKGEQVRLLPEGHKRRGRSSSGPIAYGILARDNPLSKIKRKGDQRPRLSETEHYENNQVCLVSGLPDEVN